MLAACGDPELGLRFEIREPYRDVITSVSVQIFEPPISAPFDCEDLAFGRVDPMTVTFSRVGQVTSDALTTPLNDIDRTAKKLFWLDGLDDASLRLVTGCAAVEAIDDDVEVSILAEPVAHVTRPTGVSLSAKVGEPLAEPVRVPVTDALGAPLTGANAAWRVIGVASSTAAGTVESDATGELTFTPDLPTRPGPFVLELRVRWAEGDPVLLSGVIAPNGRTVELAARAVEYQKGNVGPNAEVGFAALVTDPPNAVRIVAAYRDSATNELRMTSSPRLFGAPALGVVDYGGRARDRIVAIGFASWNEVAPDGSLTPRTYATPVGATVPKRVLTTGPCTASRPQDQPQVLVEFVEGVVGIYSVEGELLSAFQLRDPSDPATADLGVVASGCVSDSTNMPLRTLIFDFGGGIGVLAAVPSPGAESFLFDSWLALGNGVTFGRPGADGRRLMFGTQLSVNDIVVSRASLSRSAAGIALAVEGSDSVPEVPDATAAGDTDGDGLVDVVSLFQRSDGSEAFAVWTALGREYLGRRISGDVDLGSADLRAPALMLLDVDGDGSDDVVLAERPGLVGSLGANRSRLEIYPMGTSR
ncbi:hypothetical protein L6R52_40680 [Myxococcota bacterium]|nr:hypothetical protein [Myxococcota bacterium]